VYGNKADKVAFFPNETNTQYSSYASYDANLDNRAKFLDRESKGLVQPQQPQPQQPQPQQ
jgi:deoxycytidine triphosphate deaminase